MTRASPALRALYCLALLTWVFPGMIIGASGWIGLATGGPWFGAVGTLAIVTLVLFRCYQVVRHADALDVRLEGNAARVLHGCGVAGMAIGTLASLAIFFLKPITLAVFGSRSDSGVEFFVMGLILWALSNVGPLGWVLFELSRLVGSGSGSGGDVRSRGAFFSLRGMAGIAVTALIVGGAAFAFTRYLGEPCGARRMADCLPGEASETVLRTVVVPESREVLFESNIAEIGYERRALFGRGTIVVLESPAASLAAAGLLPRGRGDSRVKVRVNAAERDGALELTLEVLDGAERVATHTYVSRGGYTLEEQARGDTKSYRLLYQVSGRAQPILPPVAPSGTWKLDDKRIRSYNLDRTFLFVRRAIRTPVEAALDARTVTVNAVLAEASSAVEPATAAEIEAKQHGTRDNAARCSAILERKDVAIRGATASGEVAPLREIRFKQAPQPVASELMHPYDGLQCSDVVFATGYDRTDRIVRIRKYSALGEPLYSLRVKLPATQDPQASRVWLALDSLKDSGSRLSFEMRAWEARASLLYFIKKERYEVRLPGSRE